MTSDALELRSEHACFGGVQRFYRHASREIGLPMQFALYLPPQALAGARVPALLYLAGLTCTEDTFATKAGAQRLAAALGLALIAPDTSPRGAGVAGEADAWDFGVGAGFYLDATQAPWATHWRMESYVLHELLPLLGRILRIAVTTTEHGPALSALGYGGFYLTLAWLALRRYPSLGRPLVLA